METLLLPTWVFRLMGEASTPWYIVFEVLERSRNSGDAEQGTPRSQASPTEKSLKTERKRGDIA
ncbi:hypothetical protein BJX99DRAFT_238972 [Aspergillus californicus]